MKARIKLARLFTYLVAFQLLNLSIYYGEFESLQTTEDRTSNVDETGSFFEFIAENVFHIIKINNKFSQKNTNKQSHLHKSFQAKLFWCTSDVHNFNPPKIANNTAITFTVNYSYLFCKEIIPPPPKSIV
jgi:hypothetical protein